MEEQRVLFRIYDVVAQTRMPLADDKDVREQTPSGHTNDSDSERTIAKLHGIVTAVRKAGAHRRFFDLLDPTGSLQVLAEADRLGEEAWTAVREISKGKRVYIQGYLGGRSREGQPTLILTRPPEIAEPLSGTLAAIQPNYKTVGTRIFIARIRDLAEACLTRLGYLRIEVRTLSASWNDIEALNPLRVLYPGFGVPVFLAPSPGPQLIETLIATGEDSVFSSTTSFMATYRSALDGVESAVVYAKTIRLSLTSLILHGLYILAYIKDDLGLSGQQNSSLPVVEYPSDDPSAALADSAHHQIQIFNQRISSGVSANLTFFRVLAERGVAPIEGAVEESSGGLPLGTLTIYPERLLPLVQHVPLRRIEHLGTR